MKLIIAGGRNIPNITAKEEINHFISTTQLSVTEIVSGGAVGVDTEAVYSAQRFGIPFKGFPAQWDKHGRAAGPIRNRQMAEYADALLLIWDEKSRGSLSMKTEMQRLGKPVYEVIIVL